MTNNMYYNQSEYDIKCEWGLRGVDALADVTDVFIIIDILSFSSCVDICVSNGAEVYPFPYNDKTAEDFANSIGAELAVSRKDNPTGEKYSLMLSSLQKIPKGNKLVLPSPNGSAISFEVKNKPVICGSLRNAKAVADYAMRNYERISLIPAGEKWEDGSMRFAVEDLIGAGAIISYLNGLLSPESLSMLAVYDHFKNKISATISATSSGKEHKSVFDSFKKNIAGVLKVSSSGKELIKRGFEKDIEIASDLNLSKSVPVLIENRFVNAFTLKTL